MNLTAVLLALTVVAAAVPLVVLLSGLGLLAPRKAGAGPFVAEVWLEWPVCRGSTLYRQRFRHHWVAAFFVKAYAKALDFYLPTHYRCSDWSGRPYLESYDYGIHFGVRETTPAEQAKFCPVWSPVLPGHTGYAGEHASAHPLTQTVGLDPCIAELLGCKL